jgi:hypothetical protein
VKNILKILEMARAAGRPVDHIKIENGSWMPLVIEYLGVAGPHGFPVVSVAHYGEMNGDLMRDPDMEFELATMPGETEVKMYPFSYRNDYMGADRQVYGLNDQGRAVTVNLSEKRAEESFARTWNKNIADQGFVKKYEADLTQGVKA